MYQYSNYKHKSNRKLGINRITTNLYIRSCIAWVLKTHKTKANSSDSSYAVQLSRLAATLDKFFCDKINKVVFEQKIQLLFRILNELSGPHLLGTVSRHYSYTCAGVNGVESRLQQFIKFGRREIWILGLRKNETTRVNNLIPSCVGICCLLHDSCFNDNKK